jgi:hypothetical protein
MLLVVVVVVIVVVVDAVIWCLGAFYADRPPTILMWHQLPNTSVMTQPARFVYSRCPPFWDCGWSRLALPCDHHAVSLTCSDMLGVGGILVISHIYDINILTHTQHTIMCRGLLKPFLIVFTLFK